MSEVAFVTGGSGYLGRNLIRYLCASGYQVNALARSPQAAASVKAAGGNPVAGDIFDQESMISGMRDCTIVVHCAALASDWGPKEEFYQHNVVGTESVINAAREAGVKSFVHVSTEAVLAGGRNIVRADESWPLPEHPQGYYPWSKGLAEKAVLAANSKNFRSVIVRPRFIWGKDDTSLLPKIVKAAQNGALRWVDGGNYLTSTCHVTNVCEGIVCAAQNGRGGETYFLTDGSDVPFREFITALLATQGIEAPSGTIPKPIFATAAYLCEWIWRLLPSSLPPPPINITAYKLIGGEVTVDDSKARRELGYAGRVSREAGLAELKQVFPTPYSGTT
jgi:nucleoside-diphosphate-sugar epimerase